MNWFQKVKRIFIADTMNDMDNNPQADQVEAHEAASQPQYLSDAAFVKLIKCLEDTHENACSCQEAYELLDEYVELVATDEQAAQLMPLVKNHMDICPDCHQEFEILLDILKSEYLPPDVTKP